MASAVGAGALAFSTTLSVMGPGQPFRMLAHNGEINTIKGNRFWMSARESSFVSDVFRRD